MTTNEYDLVTVDIFAKALENIASEMGMVMMRSSGSPAIAEAVDFSTFIADPKGDIICYSGYIPFYLGPARQAVRHIVQTVPREQIRPGDMFICNDPFTTGSSHQMDIGVVRPIFAGDELIAWCWAEAHVADFGGIAPGGFAPMATETYGEALRLPGIKIVDQGELIDDIWRIIETNIRVPHMVLSDIRCFIAACNRCDDRMQALLERYGLSDFKRYVGISQDLAEEAVRKRIRSLPDGVYETEDFVEHNGHTNDLYKVHCKLTVDADRMIFDFSGSARQTDGFVNCSAPTTFGAVTTPLLMSLFCDLPINEGMLRPIELVTKPETVCDVRMPAPVSAGHMETGMRVMKVVTALMGQIQAQSDDPFVREHVMAPWQDSWNGSVFYAPDEGGQLAPFLDMHGGGSGGGGQAVADGMDVGGALGQPQNSVPDIEINELSYPVLYLWRRLNANSGGPGRYRGGDGLDLAWTPWLSEGGPVHVFVSCWQVPPPGMVGGYPGSSSGFDLVNGAHADAVLASGRIPTTLAELDGKVRALDAKHFGMVADIGDVLHMHAGGGGGYGDPLRREPTRVADDISAGIISVAAARAAYGVVLTSGGALDETATEAERARLRAERLDWELVGLDSEAVRVRRGPAADRLSELDQWCQPLDTVELIEVADAETGDLLRVEVRVTGDDLVR
ncbi:hydantoinase B/oxoprolinase family protein [Rhodococcus wratislaviensis]|uniref:Hydantoinase B n=1 Tax=Rhodococcus wratislaviensis NBRC 100605 TaxID=1219028 RepID=X0Q395_RHOWR|nr:hydantoinase B/oxoprolinase family protein [Rhodococcus wratislaviensis]GAF45512.1 hydantoinase B [Rhodococcus wratislaviensis NBRC 100605]